jgi:hypothetical protein
MTAAAAVAEDACYLASHKALVGYTEVAATKEHANVSRN